MNRSIAFRAFTIIAIATSILVASACTSSGGGADGPHRIVFGGREYRSRGLGATVPPERLSLAGSTMDATSTEPVARADVYTIDGLDPSIVVVALFIYAESAGVADDPMVERTGRNAYLFLREGQARYPQEACAFFDPVAMGAHGPLAPEECR